MLHFGSGNAGKVWTLFTLELNELSCSDGTTTALLLSSVMCVA
jgi:hypothetical protein